MSDASTDAERVRALGLKISALASNGLAFTTNEYDIDRYHQLQDIADELLSLLSGHPGHEIRAAMGLDGGYVTPKVDVRGVLFDDTERVLLMREKIDGKWSLPGGWADPGDPPSQATEREMLEESGHFVRATKLIGCWDRDTQGHTPPMAVHVYKLFFLCEQTAPPRPPSELETLDLGWFPLNALPELSESRVLAHQLQKALDHHRDPGLPAEFD